MVAERSRIPHAVNTSWIEAGTIRPKPKRDFSQRFTTRYSDSNDARPSYDWNKGILLDMIEKK